MLMAGYKPFSQRVPQGCNGAHGPVAVMLIHEAWCNGPRICHQRVAQPAHTSLSGDAYQKSAPQDGIPGLFPCRLCVRGSCTWRVPSEWISVRARAPQIMYAATEATASFQPDTSELTATRMHSPVLALSLPLRRRAYTLHPRPGQAMPHHPSAG